MKGRKTGFGSPLHPMQVFGWGIFGVDGLIIFAIVIPAIRQATVYAVVAGTCFVTVAVLGT